MNEEIASNGDGQCTIIGSTCRIKGDVTLEGDATVLGQIAGRMEVTGDLEIGESGEIRGPVHAGAMVSRGKIDGPVACEQTIELHGSITGTVACGETIHIGPNASLVGDLFARAVTIADGATYRGHLVIAPNALNEAQRVFSPEHEGLTGEPVPFPAGKFSEVKPVSDNGAAEVGQTVRRRSGLLTRAGA